MRNRSKKDRIFVFVIAVTVASLSYQLIKTAIIITGGAWANLFLWTLAAGDIIAIIGMLWLLQNNRKRRRLEGEWRARAESKPNNEQEEQADKED